MYKVTGSIVDLDGDEFNVTLDDTWLYIENGNNRISIAHEDWPFLKQSIDALIDGAGAVDISGAAEGDKGDD